MQNDPKMTSSKFKHKTQTHDFSTNEGSQSSNEIFQCIWLIMSKVPKMVQILMFKVTTAGPNDNYADM